MMAVNLHYPEDLGTTGSWELGRLQDLDPYVPGPDPLPSTVDTWWDVHGGQGEPRTKSWRFTELLEHHGPEEVIKIPEVRRLLEVIWACG